MAWAERASKLAEVGLVDMGYLLDSEHAIPVAILF
jgi:hypothetical protein